MVSKGGTKQAKRRPGRRAPELDTLESEACSTGCHRRFGLHIADKENPLFPQRLGERASDLQSNVLIHWSPLVRSTDARSFRM